MRVLIVRHAIAEDRATFADAGLPDSERPLTERGRQRMEQAAAGLRSVLPSIECIASSALVRARQTAEIIAAAYGKSQVQSIAELAPGGEADDVVRWLNAQSGVETAALVGHEPDLSLLVSYLLTGTYAASVTMKKGAACLIEFTGDVEPGAGGLRWLLAPKHLRLLGGGSA